MASSLIADGVWSIYLTPHNGTRLLDGEDTNVVRARELYALAIAEAPATTQVELVTPSGRIARVSAGTKPEPEPPPEYVIISEIPIQQVTPLTDVAVGLSAAGWNVRGVHQDDHNFFCQPCIELEHAGEPAQLIDAVERLRQELYRLEVVGWTAEARYGYNTGACLLVVGIVVIIG